MPSILAIFKGSKWLIRVQKKWGDLELQIRRDYEGSSKTVGLSFYKKNMVLPLIRTVLAVSFLFLPLFGRRPDID